ncbi:VOC family protein [Streptomyces sp. NRRL S-87]|uniref:VOC family protein n=1 Tax=Streptomyces sp. NRRL S-87 TaxID=1463920 RepID=UPI0004BFF1A6|nr:VOC family protein [Streptomyces sp. NRRL S-87]
MAIAKLGTVVLDCPDPLALAEFYAALLGGTAALEEDGTWADLAVPGGPALAFQKASGHVPPRWPSEEGSQQFHLDLTVEDLDAAGREAVALGAKPLDPGPEGRTWRVFADPAGHPFCLCAC